VKEIMLLGQNVNAYRGVMESGEIADFALLLEYVADIPGIERLRFVTSHPKEFTQRLIDAYAKIPQLVNHLYLPVQHGSDRILQAMKRGYTGAGIQIDHPPHQGGAPGHRDLVRLHRRLPRRDRCRFRGDDEAGAGRRLRQQFQLHLQQAPRHAGRQPGRRYPARGQAGAPAAPAGPDRRQHPQDSAAMVGSVQRILVEGPSKKDPSANCRAAPRTTGSSFSLPGQAGDALIGQLVDVRITESLDYSLRGDLVANLDTIAKAS
jgi:tRNA-2-methylthio-N6-dimethylallyladenosine synthase